MEQTKDRIIAKDLLDTSGISLNTLARRVDTIIRSMLDDCILSIKKDVYSSIEDRDRDVNRLTYLSYRVIKFALRSPRVTKSIGIDNVGLLDTWRLFYDLERIGDEAKRVARIFVNEKRTSKKESEDVEKLCLEIRNYYLDVMKSYYNNDIEAAYELASRKSELIKKCDALFLKYKDVFTGKLAERLKGMITYIRNICRVVYG